MKIQKKKGGGQEIGKFDQDSDTEGVGKRAENLPQYEGNC